MSGLAEAAVLRTCDADTLETRYGKRKSRSPRTPTIVGTAAAVVTFAAYLPGLGRSLDFDSAETVGVFVKPGPPWAVSSRQSVFNNHPMFSFFEQLVRVVTGRTDAATMRLLPILCGALAVGVLTWFAARRLGIVPAVVAGAVLAFNPTFAELSRSVRGYSLLTLCAVVSTVIVVEGGRDGSHRWAGASYVAVAAIGLATHLYMLPVLAAHAGLVIARQGFDRRWIRRFLWVAALAGVAYAGMAGLMLKANSVQGRSFQLGLPARVGTMITGGGAATVLILPLVLAGAVVVLRSQAARGAAIALVAALLFLWAGLQSAALTERFFVWMVPAVAWLAAVTVSRLRVSGVAVVVWIAAVAVTLAPGYTSDPTAYRQAARLIRTVDAKGGQVCVPGLSVAEMEAYADSPRQFRAIESPEQLRGCNVVVVVAWWPTDRAWYAADKRIVTAAQAMFPNRATLDFGDPTLVLSDRPLQEWTS